MPVARPVAAALLHPLGKGWLPGSSSRAVHGRARVASSPLGCRRPSKPALFTRPINCGNAAKGPPKGGFHNFGGELWMAFLRGPLSVLPQLFGLVHSAGLVYHLPPRRTASDVLLPALPWPAVHPLLVFPRRRLSKLADTPFSPSSPSAAPPC